MGFDGDADADDACILVPRQTADFAQLDKVLDGLFGCLGPIRKTGIVVIIADVDMAGLDHPTRNPSFHTMISI
jgi:hypothetical protein